MKGNAYPLESFIQDNKVEFIIPVYQRKYDWNTDNCEQLFSDLKKLALSEGRKKHFFGSIVTSRADDSGYDRLVIDGQQRLTTVSLLLLAGIRAVESEAMTIQNKSRLEEARENFLYAKYHNSDRKIKLVPIDDDRKDYDLLFSGDEESFNESSRLTKNYRYFLHKLTAPDLPFTFDRLLDAVEGLEIVHIVLESGDDAQLIFESLNSTGLALEEGDKIRNYMLMSLTPGEQKSYYRDYWQKMERQLGGELTRFLRDYLTIRLELLRPVRQNKIYAEWKKYMAERDRKEELASMLTYATYYDSVIHATLSTPRLSRKMQHICNIGSDVTNIFFVQFLKYADEARLSEEEIYKVIDVVENYLARRIICNLPGNSLTQVSCALHRDVQKSIEEYSRAGEPIEASYSEILTYHLLRREGTAMLPRDTQFKEAIQSRDVYHMLKPFQIFLFERLENAVPGEYNDVAREMRHGEATIEHIMPQNLNAAWQEMLGSNWEVIHERYLDTFANLTLTGINSELSNKSFPEKRDGKHDAQHDIPGYKDSKYRMTRAVTACEQWTETELLQRAADITQKLLKLYPLPALSFRPLPKPVDEVGLDDETFDPTGRTLKGFRLWGETYDETVWKQLQLRAVRLVMERYPDAVDALYDQGSYFWTEEKANKDYCTPIGQGKYLWTSMDNRSKLSCLRYLFEHCDIAAGEMVILMEPRRSQLPFNSEQDANTGD